MQYLDFREHLFVPIQERESYILPVQRGCSYGNCSFCPLKLDEFKMFSLEEISKDLKEFQSTGIILERVYLTGHNSLGLWTNFLVEVLERIYEELDFVKEVSLSSHILDILEKSEKDLLLLKENGLTDIHICMGSASNEVLDFMNFGYHQEDIKTALEKLEKTGLNYHLFYIPGLGGREYSYSHQKESSHLISQFQPKSIWSAGLVVWYGTPLYEEVMKKKFRKLNQMEMAEEEIHFLANLKMNHETNYINTNYMNFYFLTGVLPREKNYLRSLLMKLFRQDDDIIKR